ncbi:maleylacetoacetate isomerase [Phenylobacterium zucineum HLK1]|uniref:Maleylacetoacetate isomerase n=1 Tax=Phenylobacterium zucineum (strain HLK1) TaxID=450851 RepID=B4RDM9_PHEZH|nr:maleylacetoacetate isomerase [Phenylobacterium zucineum]ACG76728.1 maleylacetoacetate isomerase [Phenylobacterium zucineum HLK1]
MALSLHSYWRAGAPYRVRIGLNLKGLSYDYVPVNLLAGDQHRQAYKALNPQGLTPALVVDEALVLTQSLAILEWLEETHPEPPLLPRAAADRAVVRAMAGIVACDIHPLNNQRVLKALAGLGVDEAGRNAWAGRWIAAGFDALEPMIARHGRGFAFGETPTLADCCLIPQVYSAGRFDVDMEPWPAIRAVAEAAAVHPAFAAARPERQPDAA